MSLQINSDYLYKDLSSLDIKNILSNLFDYTKDYVTSNYVQLNYVVNFIFIFYVKDHCVSSYSISNIEKLVKDEMFKYFKSEEGKKALYQAGFNMESENKSNGNDAILWM